MRALALFAVIAVSFACLSGCSEGPTTASARILIQAKDADISNEQIGAEMQSLQTISRKHLGKTEMIEIKGVSGTRMVDVVVYGTDIPAAAKKCRAIVTEYVNLKKEGIEKSIVEMVPQETEKQTSPGG
jgi:hypothetical protein